MDTLKSFEAFCLTITPRANSIDQDRVELLRAVQELHQRRLIQACRSQVDGSAPTKEERELELFQIKVALSRSSGALTFLCVQMLSAQSLLLKFGSKQLLGKYLNGGHSDLPRLGIAYGFLRRRGKIPLKAVASSEGYVVEGRIPWATGFGFFDSLLVGAELPDSRHLLFMLPFCASSGLEISEPLPLASMGVTNTVAVRCNQYFVPESETACILEPEWLEKRDEQRVVEGASYALGCAKRSIELLESQSLGMGCADGGELARSLLREWSELIQAVEKVITGASLDITEQRLLRGRCHEISVRAAFAAVVSASGAGNMLTHDAQRLYREALAWSVLAQTPEVQRGQFASLKG